MTPAPAQSRTDFVACAAAAVMVGALCFKATSAIDPMPGWSGDPTLVASPILGMTPVASIIADLALCAAASVATWIGFARCRASPRATILLALLLSALLAGTAIHLPHATADPSLAFTLAAWQAALICGVGAFALRHVPRARAILGAGLVALVAALTARALVQYFVEQPAAFATFKANKSAFLAAQGWAEGSPNALAYERRVSQQEASAWFGMANVLASYGAAFAGCFGTWALAAFMDKASRATSRSRAALLACAAASVALVVMAGSKGGYAALALALCMALVSAWRAARASHAPAPRAAWALGPVLITLAIAAIVARGVIGERLGELSLLFRWHYMVGAARAFIENPMAGVSPTGFKDAYMRLKPPTSPEDVTSAHNLLMDLATGLGVVGVAWAVISIVAAAFAGRSIIAPSAPAAETSPREHVPLASSGAARACFLALAMGTIAAAWLESIAVTPEGALVRVLTIAGGMAVAGAALRVYERSARVFSAGLGVGAVVLLVHSQIELTWSVTISAPLLAALVGLGAGGLHQADSTAPKRAAHATRLAAALPAIATVAMVAWLLPNVVVWERSLRRAYDDAAPLASLNERLQSLAAAAQARDPIARDLASSLAVELLDPAAAKTPFSIQDLAAAYGRRRLDQMALALEHLEPAQRVATRDIETHRAISALALRLAIERQQAGMASAAQAAERAILIAHNAAAANPASASAASWVATTHRTLAASLLQGIPAYPDPQSHRAQEITWLQRAASLAPFEPSHAAWLADAYAASGDGLSASKWAREALARDALLRLDPIRQLDPIRRSRLETLANQPG